MSSAGLVVAAVNAVWQTGLLTILAGVSLRFARASAAAHAAVWSAVFFVAVALAPLDLAFERTATTATAPSAAVTHAPSAVRSGPIREVVEAARVASSARSARLQAASVVSAVAWRASLPLVLLWCLVALWRLGRLARGVRSTLLLKARAQPFEEAPIALVEMVRSVRGSRLALSERVEVPCAIGYLRPMVLLPRALVDRLEPADLYAAVAHELAHLRRYDDVIQLAQHLGLALFFFNPLLYAASRRLDFYREAACDDQVIESKASALRYAQCLALIVERSLRYRHATVPALAAERRQVSARVERLVNWREGTRTMGRVAILIALAICATALFFVRAELPLLFPQGTPHTDRTTHSHETIAIADNGDEETLLGALAAAGYHPSVDDVIALSNAGVCTDLVTAVRRSGMEPPSIDGLVQLANAGVDQDLIVAAARAFGSGIAVGDLVRLQEAGIDESDISDLHSAGISDMSISDIVALHEAGVDADYLRHITGHGHDHISVRDIIRLHEAGVDV